jgi:plastocyanin
MRMPLLFALLLSLIALPAQAADEMPVFRLDVRDGVFDPATIEVPAGTRFKIEISNVGKGPIEFESRDLRQEKVLAPGAKSYVVINALKPGTYTFFDEYHMGLPKGKIIVK